MNKNLVMDPPTEPKTDSDYTVENQQQISALLRLVPS
jgi:hypothetical protein